MGVAFDVPPGPEVQPGTREPFAIRALHGNGVAGMALAHAVMTEGGSRVVYEVHISARSLDPFETLLGPARVRAIRREVDAARQAIGSRVVWNINSTSTGGGVAEMLRSLLRYARGLGIDTRWLVIEGPSEFFRLTKRLHNALHGSIGDGSPLGPDQADLYARVTHENLVAFDDLVRPSDVVVCHDPQTAGLVPHFVAKGCHVVWRCHIGHEVHDAEVDRGWALLRPHLEHVPIAVFSRGAYAPAWLDAKRTRVLAPNIDPFSAKNQMLDPDTVRSILVGVGLLAGPAGSAPPIFVRDDGSAGRVDRKAEMIRLGPPLSPAVPLVVQVSRWDAIKDPIGVLKGFASLAEPGLPGSAALVLAGPSVHSVTDDPEGAEVFAALEHSWRELSDSLRARVNLALLPTGDSEENAAIVNALQRHASVIVQKSLHEGFGLTVTEAMWKKTPVVATNVGGIRDQIRDEVDGLLVRDPTDLREFASAIRRVLGDRALAQRLGEHAQERVKEHYLVTTALERWSAVVRSLVTLRYEPR